MPIGLGLGLTSGGTGATYIPSLDFSDARNSQFLWILLPGI